MQVAFVCQTDYLFSPFSFVTIFYAWIAPCPWLLKLHLGTLLALLDGRQFLMFLMAHALISRYLLCAR